MYVGNLSFDASEAEVRELFSQHGTSRTSTPHGPHHRPHARFRVRNDDSKEAMDAAINALNGQQFMGRALTINEARPREERPSFGGAAAVVVVAVAYGGGGGGGGGGGRGGRSGGGYGGGGGGGGRDRY